MLIKTITETPVREPAMPLEDPQFFLPVPTQREPEIFQMNVPEPLRENDFSARWWPGTDISETREDR